MIKNFVDSINKCLNEKNANILMPVKNLTVILDLLDIFLNKFNKRNLNFFIVSEACSSIIGYANGNIEYLN